METIELLAVLECGEDSHRQFKKNITNADSLAAEMVAFSNTGGGQIFIGIDDDGIISGLTADDIRRLNQLISNTASQGIQPAINPETENIKTGQGLVMLVNVPAGINKPYQDKNGVFWVKCGSDKRKATSREEIQRLFQSSNLLHADETPVSGATLADLDLDYFKDFFKNEIGETLDSQKVPLPEILKNMNLMKGDLLNVGGALLFASKPQFKLPNFIVKAVAFPGNDTADSHYNASLDIKGKMVDVFREAVNFVIANIHHIQGDQDFNSVGIPEIPREVLVELISNALIHRDYFIDAPIRVFVLRNRVEIISPGHLPNNITVENIKMGLSNARNPIIASFASSMMDIQFRGIGTGIRRALSLYPNIDFVDDRAGNLFKVILKRG